MKFVLSELLRLSPTVVQDGKKKLAAEGKKTTSLKEIVEKQENSKYESQLVTLMNMGFTDRSRNILALKAAQGNTQVDSWINPQIDEL